MSEEVLDLKRFLSSVKLGDPAAELTPMVSDNLSTVKEDVGDEDRFLSALAALVYNVEPVNGKLEKNQLADAVDKIDALINAQINDIIHDDNFQKMESQWTALNDIIQHTNFRANVVIDFLDAGKDELAEDFEDNSVDITGGALFKKTYISEYDQYGGKPYGALVGFYEFEHNPKELFWLRQMGKIAAVSHAPFLGSLSPKFFGCDTIEELAALKDVTALLNQPKYGAWNTLRDTPEAAYLGLTLPRYVLRLPWHPETNPCGGDLPFVEETNGNDDSRFLWGPATALLARNMIKSFEGSGWCQYLRGPKGGGLVSGLPAHTMTLGGESVVKAPVEMQIPDFRELEFANAGLIPLIYRKGTADCCFFSVQAVKAPKKFKDPKDSENAQLVCNLSYTFSVTRVAHYLKCMMRDNIGSSADGDYVKLQIENWIGQYITTVTNPDNLTLRYFPFKAATVDVQKQEGLVGQYSCQVAILPHVQFEGMDCELRLESRLG